MDDHYEQRDWIDNTAAAAAPLLGAAAGVLIADLIDRDARRTVGLTLAALGLAALGPSMVETIVDRVNGPQSKRGSLRRLQTIRDGSQPAREIRYIEDELGEELGVG